MAQLESLMEYGADVSLKFDDGVLPANSILLGLHSSVLRGAVETAAASDASPSTRKRKREGTIPMPDTKKDDWLQTAAFLCPVVPPPVISSWAQLEVLLKVASRFDIQLLLHKSEEYITSNASTLVTDPKSEQCIWKWVQLADKSGLQQCLSALADRATSIDRAGCSDVANLAGLTQHALQQLVVSCAGRPGRPALGDTSNMQCYSCAYGSTKTHRVAWICGNCDCVNHNS